MDIKEQITLDYPEEFKIACKINYVEHEELLQYFIDHVSFYAFIGGQMQASCLWSTTVCMDCKEFWGKSSVAVTDDVMKGISLQYIKKLTVLTLRTDLTPALEAAESMVLMKEWELEMQPLTDYPLALKLSTGSMLRLTFDFNLLCRMNGIDTRLLLQYFIDSISLAKERAVNILREIKFDPSTAVLLTLAASPDASESKILPHQEIYREYGLQLLQLDKKQKEEYKLENRIRNYTQFYRLWYDALNNA